MKSWWLIKDCVQSIITHHSTKCVNCQEPLDVLLVYNPGTDRVNLHRKNTQQLWDASQYRLIQELWIIQHWHFVLCHFYNLQMFTVEEYTAGSIERMGFLRITIAYLHFPSHRGYGFCLHFFCLHTVLWSGKKNFNIIQACYTLLWEGEFFTVDICAVQ